MIIHRHDSQPCLAKACRLLDEGGAALDEFLRSCPVWEDQLSERGEVEGSSSKEPLGQGTAQD